MSQISIDAIADTDSGQRSTSAAAVASIITDRFVTNQVGTGWPVSQASNNSYVISTANGGFSSGLTATITSDCGTGSNACVTITGGTWTSDKFPVDGSTEIYRFMLYSSTTYPSCLGAGGGTGVFDSKVFYATYVDSTHISLDRPYDGDFTVGVGGHGFENATYNGCGIQPFMMGVAGTSFYLSKLALEQNSLSSTTATQFVLDSADWIKDNGILTSYLATPIGGLWYAQTFVNCNQTTLNTNCTGIRGTTDADIQSSRYLALEVVRCFSSAYLISHDAALKTTADTLYGAMYGGDGGPYADSNYLYLYLNAGEYDWINYKAKTYGFSAGWGGGATWPAARLDGFTFGSRLTGNVKFSGNVVIH